MSHEITEDISQHHEIVVYDNKVDNGAMCEEILNINVESTNRKSNFSGPR